MVDVSMYVLAYAMTRCYGNMIPITTHPTFLTALALASAIRSSQEHALLHAQTLTKQANAQTNAVFLLFSVRIIIKFCLHLIL